MGVEFYLPLYLQGAKQASPLRSGVLILPFSLMAAVSGIIAGAVLNKTGRYAELIRSGAVFLTLGSGLLILLNAGSSVATITGLQVIAGSATGVLFQPVLLAIQANVPGFKCRQLASRTVCSVAPPANPSQTQKMLPRMDPVTSSSVTQNAEISVSFFFESNSFIMEKYYELFSTMCSLAKLYSRKHSSIPYQG